MKVTATRAYEIHLGFVTPNGVTLPVSTASPNYVIIDDKYADHASLLALVANGHATLTEFSGTSTAPIGQTEFNEIAQGLYVCTYPTNIPGAISGGTNASMLSVGTEPFDLRAKNYFRFYVDGTLGSPVFDIELYVATGVYTAASLAAALMANASFAAHLVAAASTTKVLITTNSMGTSAFVVAQTPVIMPLANANDILAFPTTAPTTPGTGTASRIAAVLKGPTGVGMPNALIQCGGFTTDSGSGDTASATAFTQVPRVGTIVSGIYTINTLSTIRSGAGGVIDIEIMDDGTHTDNPLFLGFLKPTGYDLAIIPTGAPTRVSIANAP